MRRGRAGERGRGGGEESAEQGLGGKEKGKDERLNKTPSPFLSGLRTLTVKPRRGIVSSIPMSRLASRPRRRTSSTEGGRNSPHPPNGVPAKMMPLNTVGSVALASACNVTSPPILWQTTVAPSPSPPTPSPLSALSFFNVSKRWSSSREESSRRRRQS